MRASPSNRRSLPFAEWPDRDRLAWLTATTADEGDLLEADRPALRWRTSSKELYLRYYGIWLAWLASVGQLDPQLPPGERVTRQRLSSYLKAQRALGVGAKTLENQAVSLRHMFEALSPEQDWLWMLPMIRKLKSVAVIAKNHSDLPSIHELFSLGIHLMKLADSKQKYSVKQRAVMYRNGLFIAVLAARPYMRRNNITTIKIGDHLLREGPVYVLRFPSDVMKGRMRRGGPLPAMLTPFIARYIDGHRPVLFLGKPDADGTLFISGMGLPVYPHAMSHEIGKVTNAAFGRRVCSHEFRHAAGSSVAKEDPKHVGIVPAILGHADYSTSEHFYIFADEHSAFQRLDKALEKLAKVQEGSDAP
jgi:integrase/recombinase XerD